MNQVPPTPQNIAANFIEAIQAHARVAVIAGLIMLLCGFLAVAAPLAAGVSITLLVGLLLTAGGIAQCLLAFRVGALGKSLLVLLVGMCTIFAGTFMLSQPIEGLEAITLFLAVYFLATGIFELIAAVQMRASAGWGWMLFNGVVTLILGLIIWRQFPLSGAWAVGILFGLKLIMGGWWLIMLGRAASNATQNK